MMPMKCLDEFAAPCPRCNSGMLIRSLDNVHVIGYCRNIDCTYTYDFQITLPFSCKELVMEWNREAAKERLRIGKK